MSKAPTVNTKGMFFSMIASKSYFLFCLVLWFHDPHKKIIPLGYNSKINPYHMLSSSPSHCASRPSLLILYKLYKPICSPLPLNPLVPHFSRPHYLYNRCPSQNIFSSLTNSATNPHCSHLSFRATRSVHHPTKVSSCFCQCNYPNSINIGSLHNIRKQPEEERKEGSS